MKDRLNCTKIERPARKQIVRAIYLDIQKKVESVRQLGKKEYRILARRLVEKYPGLTDKVDNDTILGNGLESIIINFEHVGDNLRRYEKDSSRGSKRKSPNINVQVLFKEKDAYAGNHIY